MRGIAEGLGILEALPSLVSISAKVGLESLEKIVPPGKIMQQSLARKGKRALPDF